MERDKRYTRSTPLYALSVMCLLPLLFASSPLPLRSNACGQTPKHTTWTSATHSSSRSAAVATLRLVVYLFVAMSGLQEGGEREREGERAGGPRPWLRNAVRPESVTRYAKMKIRRGWVPRLLISAVPTELSLSSQPLFQPREKSSQESYPRAIDIQ